MMIRFLKYLLTIALLSFVMFEAVMIGIMRYPKGVFHFSYQSLIVDKYRKLQNTNEPKIIVVDGSSSAFGLDQKLLEKETGYKVVDLGLHADFGCLFVSELAKENINKGDIVLLGYEYNWMNDFDRMNQALIMTGVDDNIDMYRHIPVRKWPDFIGYIFKYAQMKYSYASGRSEKASGIYSREAFDSETTQMTMYREYEMDYPENRDFHGQINIACVEISDETVRYLTDFKKLIEDRGANVYFICPPLLKQAVACDYSEFERLKELEEKEIGIPFISDPTDYFFDDELMSNAIFHCSSKGEKVRTELLAADLRSASIIKQAK